MYHVSTDKRAVKSAELIWEGLEKCLEEKELKKIRIADINEKSYISRATFYRLFDSIEDVLVYRCDKVFDSVVSEIGAFSSTMDMFLFFIERWLEQKTLLRAIAENNMTNLIYATHMKNKEIVKRVYIREAEITEADADYLISILTSILPAVMNTWYEHGKKESAEEIYEVVKKSVSIMASAFGNG